VRRGATGAALLLAGLLAVVLLIVGTGSIVISALSTSDPIYLVQDIDFGVVLPGEDYPDDFEICIKDPATGDHVDYTLTLTEKPLDPGDPDGDKFPDMRPFLVAQSDPPTEVDPLADGPAGDYQAEGDLDSPGDECDSWTVTLTAPHCEEAYNQFTDPQGNGATIPCDVDEPTPDPQTWSEGSDLGAELEINVTVSRQ
jgi:hypothetical protein